MLPKVTSVNSLVTPVSCDDQWSVDGSLCTRETWSSSQETGALPALNVTDLSSTTVNTGSMATTGVEQEEILISTK